MTILSDTDIKKELGKNIIIYPFKKSQLKGASYNLTASKLAWSLTTRQSIYLDGKIIIEPGTTALIETHEVIWVSPKIAGTYHSKVGMVSQGTGHIGTTLDPNYIGPSLIAIHNHYYPLNGIDQPKPITLIPGDEEDAIATLVFHYVMSEATRKEHGNYAGRIEILTNPKVGIDLKEEERRALSKDFMIYPETLKFKMEKECEDYKQIEQERQREAEEIEKRLKQENEEKEKQDRELIQREAEEIEKRRKQEDEEKEKQRQEEADKFFSQWYIIVFLVIIGLSVVSAILFASKENSTIQFWYSLFTPFIDRIIILLVGALITLKITDIQRKAKKFEN